MAGHHNSEFHVAILKSGYPHILWTIIIDIVALRLDTVILVSIVLLLARMRLLLLCLCCLQK